MMRAHPAAVLFPMMSAEEISTLATDIRFNGLREPITVFESDGETLILDGRNRFEACRKGGVEPVIERFTDGDPFAFVVSKNLQRRHLDASQRAMIADKLATMRNGGDRKSISRPSGLLIQDDAAALLNVSPRNVRRARRVSSKGTPELAKAVEDGELSVTAAALITKLPIDEQRAAADAQKKKRKRVVERTKAEPKAKPKKSAKPSGITSVVPKGWAQDGRSTKDLRASLRAQEAMRQMAVMVAKTDVKQATRGITPNERSRLLIWKKAIDSWSTKLEAALA